MEREIFVKMAVRDELAIKNNLGTLDYAEQKLRSLLKDGIWYTDMIMAESDSDSPHERYLNYLLEWIFSHHDEEYQGCSPAGYDEWLNNEDKED